MAVGSRRTEFGTHRLSEASRLRINRPVELRWSDGDVRFGPKAVVRLDAATMTATDPKRPVETRASSWTRNSNVFGRSVLEVEWPIDP
jgi:hypothetical protein